MIQLLGVERTIDSIKASFDDYERQAYDIFKFYAGEIMAYFTVNQTNVPAEIKGAFWTNHTFKAAKSFFTKAYQVPSKYIGMNLNYHSDPFYTKYLEFGHEGRFSAIQPLLDRFYPLVIHDLQVLYGEINA